jgi:hypothetical protein
MMDATPFVYDCNVEAGFAMDPNEHPRVGYVVALDGFGLTEAMKADLQVYVPYNNTEQTFTNLTLEGSKFEGAAGGSKAGTGPKTAKVVGVIDNFEWNGGACDPIQLEFCVSQQNANAIHSLLQSALKNTMVKSLSWWIADYDPEVKAWFEEAFVLGTGAITGHVNNRKKPALGVEMEPVKVKEGIGVKVFKVTLDVVPAGEKKYQLHFATSHMQKVARIWGALIG